MDFVSTSCPYFRSEVLKIEREASLFAGPESFHSLVALAGSGRLEIGGLTTLKTEV